MELHKVFIFIHFLLSSTTWFSFKLHLLPSPGLFLPEPFLSSVLFSSAMDSLLLFCLLLPASQFLCPSIHDCRLMLCETITLPLECFKNLFLLFSLLRFHPLLATYNSCHFLTAFSSWRCFTNPAQLFMNAHIIVIILQERRRSSDSLTWAGPFLCSLVWLGHCQALVKWTVIKWACLAETWGTLAWSSRGRGSVDVIFVYYSNIWAHGLVFYDLRIVFADIYA